MFQLLFKLFVRALNFLPCSHRIQSRRLLQGIGAKIGEFGKFGGHFSDFPAQFF